MQCNARKISASLRDHATHLDCHIGSRPLAALRGYHTCALLGLTEAIKHISRGIWKLLYTVMNVFANLCKLWEAIVAPVA